MKQFNEKTLQGFEDRTDRAKVQKLKRSKPVQLWLNFFSEWFETNNIDLKDVLILNGLPGSPMMLVPEGVTLEKVFQILKERCNLKTNIQNPNKEVEQTRRKRATYLLYEKNKLTLLEECLAFLFLFYKSGKVPELNRTSIFFSGLSWSKHQDGTRIRANLSKNYNNSSGVSVWDGSYYVSIWKGY